MTKSRDARRSDLPSEPPASAQAGSDRREEPVFPRRGDIYYVDLDPVVGSEQGGRRPALVIQNDIGNQYSPVLIVAALTSRPAALARPTDVLIEAGPSGLQVTSRVLLNQIRTLDKRRLGRYIGQLTPDEMANVDRAIQVSLGLIPL
jgi:mRNA interferase MazF